MVEVERVLGDVSDFITHSNPGDGRITGPTDYLSEVNEGLLDHIYNRIGIPRF